MSEAGRRGRSQRRPPAVRVLPVLSAAPRPHRVAATHTHPFASASALLPYLDCEMPSSVEDAWAFWRAIGSPRYVTAPMVKQSELAFRSLTRKHGAGLCYTPMINAPAFVNHPRMRAMEFETSPDDTPLFGQLAGHDPSIVLEAAHIMEPNVSAVDLNFGCPQKIAHRGRCPGRFFFDEQLLGTYCYDLMLFCFFFVLEPNVSAVDLKFACPQTIAHRGRCRGAFSSP